MVAAVLLAILVIKPWQQFPADPGPSTHESSHEIGLDNQVADVPPGPTVTPGPSDIACEGGWRLVSITHQATWTIKSWTPVDPSSGPGPVDPSIPFIALDGDVRAVGVCADGQELGGTDRNLAIRDAWRVTNAGGRLNATRIPLAAIEVGARPGAFARLYRPRAPAETATWLPGRYVLELDLPGATWWLGIVVAGASRKT